MQRHVGLKWFIAIIRVAIQGVPHPLKPLRAFLDYRNEA